MPSHDVNAKTPRRRGARRNRTAEHADHAEITASFEVHNAEPHKGGTTYLKCQRAAEAWSISATKWRLYAARPSSFFLRGSSSRLHAASLLAGWMDGRNLSGQRSRFDLV